MLKRLGASFADLNYSYCGSVHSVPGSEISKITELAEQYGTNSDLIVVNSGINNLLNGYSVANCMREYERMYEGIRNSCTAAHVAFASVSYIARDEFTNIDQSGVINPLVEELNAQLESYCQQNDYTIPTDKGWLTLF